MDTDPTPGLFALSVGGAVLAAWLTPRRPITTFGILFLLASLTRPAVETPIGTMRLEQPAIAAVAVVLLVTGRVRDIASLPRWAWAVGGLLAVYLAVLTLSSALIAPDPVASLRIDAWWAISLVGGAVAVILVGPRVRAAIVPIGLVAGVMAVVGFVAALVFFVGGPVMDLGVQDPDSALPRVYGLAFEANIYASFLAACVPFGLAMARSVPGRRLGVVIVVSVVLAIPLGMTRAAFLGLAVGVATYIAVVAWNDRRQLVPLVGLGAVVALATVVGFGLAGVLLLGPGERGGPPIAVTPAPLASSTASVSGLASSAGVPPQVPASGSVAVDPPSTAVPSPPPSPPPSSAAPDTIAFRLERVPPALADLATSPIVGLGADSFGQRHRDPTIGDAPDHLAILAVAVPYESGVTGTVALSSAFAIVVVALWRAARRVDAREAAAAYLAWIATLAVAYQATNALHFAVNWLIVGAAVALAARAGPIPVGDEGVPTA